MAFGIREIVHLEPFQLALDVGLAREQRGHDDEGPKLRGHASGELEASKQLAEAAGELSAQPASLHLRYLQTLVEISAEKNSTVIFPVPIDWVKALMGDK